MAEPNSTGIGVVVLLIGGLSPFLGQFGLIVACSLIGAMWSLKRANTEGNKKEGAKFLLRIVLTACVLSGAGASLLANWLGIELYDAMAIVALVIGGIGNDWKAIFAIAGNKLKSLVSGK